jgi:Ras-related protein Rab-2A
MYYFILKIDAGKSALLYQFIMNKFKTDHDITIGVEFLTKNLLIDDLNIRLQVWDTVLF